MHRKIAFIEVFLAGEWTKFWTYWKMVALCGWKVFHIALSADVKFNFWFFSSRIQIAIFESRNHNFNFEFHFKFHAFTIPRNIIYIPIPVEICSSFAFVSFMFALFQAFIKNSRICGSSFLKIDDEKYLTWTSCNRSLHGVCIYITRFQLVSRTCHENHPVRTLLCNNTIINANKPNAV